jgi:hypothetical protein
MTQAIVVGAVALGAMVTAGLGVFWFAARDHRRRHDLDHSR